MKLHPILKFRCIVRTNNAENFSIKHPDFIIGRADDCGVRLVFPEVSRRHCHILVNDANQVTFTDLRENSMGLWHNTKRVRQGVLKEGDRLFIGYTCLELLQFTPGKPGSTEKHAEAIKLQTGTLQNLEVAASNNETAVMEALQLDREMGKEGSSMSTSLTWIPLELAMQIKASRKPVANKHKLLD